MAILIIEHLKASELPPQWSKRLQAGPEQTFTVRIETEREQDISKRTETYVSDDPAFGMWRDHEAVADVDRYVRSLRGPRYSHD